MVDTPAPNAHDAAHDKRAAPVQAAPPIAESAQNLAGLTVLERGSVAAPPLVPSDVLRRAAESPQGLDLTSIDYLLHIQRRYGNRQAARMVQAARVPQAHLPANGPTGMVLAQGARSAASSVTSIQQAHGASESPGAPCVRVPTAASRLRRQAAPATAKPADGLTEEDRPDLRALPEPSAPQAQAVVDATAPLNGVADLQGGNGVKPPPPPPAPKQRRAEGGAPNGPASAAGASSAPAPPVSVPLVQAPPAAAATVGPDGVIDPNLARSNIDFSTWTLDDILSGGRMVLEFTRIIPGWGALTGMAADVTGAYQDVKAIPKGSYPLTEALILVRHTINIGNNVLGHVKYVTELIQDGLAGSVIFSEFIPVSANAIELEALVKVFLDAALFVVDFGVELGAVYNQSQVDPASPEFAAWQGLIDGYQANLIGDVVGTVLDIVALSSAGAANTGAVKEVTAMFPLGRLLIKNLGTILIDYARAIFNVYGSGAPGIKGEQFPNTKKPAAPAQGVGPGKGAAPNAVGAPGTGGGIGKKAVQAAALLAAADIISGETSQARIAWNVVDVGIGLLEDEANKRLAELDAIVMLLSGGHSLFEVIRDGSLQAIAMLRERLDQITQFESMAAQGRTVAEDVRGKADGVIAKIDAFTVPDVTIPDVDLGDSALADAAESVLNAAKDAANSALRATVGQVRKGVETAKGEVRAPVEVVRDKAIEFIDFLVIAEKFSLQQKASIAKYADNLENGLKQAGGFEDGVNVLIAQFTTLMGLPSFKIQDIRDEWAAIPDYLDRLDVVAANMRIHAARLQNEDDEAVVPVVAAAGVPPEKP